jgi:putrescine transport system ATP-binding protein
VSRCERGFVTLACEESRCDLTADAPEPLTPGERVWLALRPEKIRLSKGPPVAEHVNQLRGTVWELGYLGNRSTYRIKIASGKLVTVFSQNEHRTSDWAIDWGDEVFISWSADAAVLLTS